MADQAVLREVTLTLPLEQPDVEIAASNTATAVAQSMAMSPDKIDEIRLAVVEACINAKEHSRAADRRVQIVCEVLGEGAPETLRITVHDNGVGFAPAAVEKPKIETKLRALDKRGWGLEIMRGLMDEVEIHSGDEGTTVVMTKARG
jgi:anti-sigma regulatory factor (Ser/Thr protein kinase)